jgi:type I restriction enzyme R subunit
MIEFKQIIGRGTRVFEGKDYFTIYDFVGAYKLFSDPEWDGDPIEVVEDKTVREVKTVQPATNPFAKEEDEIEREPKKQRIKIKLRDGKEREIQHMISTSFWSADGKPVSVQEFMDGLFGAMPQYFKNEDELRKIWSNPNTRKTFLDAIAAQGYGRDELESLQKMIDAEQSDLFDVLSYVSFLTPPISRVKRVEMTRDKIFDDLDVTHKEFLAFVLTKYEEKGVDELSEEMLPVLLNLKYHAIADAEQSLGDVMSIRTMFLELQKELYSK